MVEEELRVRRFRVVRRDRSGAGTESAWSSGPELSAEKGYLKEAGNLLFHLSLLGLLLGLAGGKLWGYEGSILVTEGQGFCNSFQQYDTYSAGSLVDSGDLAPLCVDLGQIRGRVRAQPDRVVVHRRHPLRRAGRGGPGDDDRRQRPAAGRRRRAST